MAKKKSASFPMKTRVLIAIVLSIISGGLLFIAYPPINFWPASWIAIVPYLIAMHRFLPLKWAPVAPTISYVIWLWPFLARIFGIPDAPFLLKHMGLFFAAINFLTSTDRKFHELTKYRWFILQGSIGWVGFEMVRSFIPILGTMGFIGNTLASQSWFIQPVSLFGVYGLSFLIILINYTLAQTLLYFIDKKWVFKDTVPIQKESTRLWQFGAEVALAGWIIISLSVFNAPQETDTVRVAALHVDLDIPGHQADDVEQKSRINTITDLSLQASAKGAQIIYMPEMLFGFNPQVDFTEELISLAEETGAYLSIPYAYQENEEWHNETILLSPEGKFSALYGKLHAFGEPRTISAGAFPVADTPLGKLGSIICMDGVFTDAAVQVARKGAQILAIPTYNTNVGISEQNWSHFVMRSVENQLPIVNADRGLYSMITNVYGTIINEVKTPAGATDFIIADVHLSSGTSPYYFIGDWFGWLSLGGFVGFAIYQNRIEKRSKPKKDSIKKK